jgi:hypothetical protein
VTELFRDVALRPESRALTRGLWARRAMMTLLAVLAVLALLGVAGQRGSTSRADGPAATLTLGAPHAVRGGLFFQARITITARAAIAHPRLVLDHGWTEGLQVNSIEPAAVSETSRDGRLELSYDAIDPGTTTTIWVQFQVDPTEPGHRAFGLELDDARRPLARIDRMLTIFP